MTLTFPTYRYNQIIHNEWVLPSALYIEHIFSEAKIKLHLKTDVVAILYGEGWRRYFDDNIDNNKNGYSHKITHNNI